jgi:uncharacterized protein (TIGR00288 family)
VSLAAAAFHHAPNAALLIDFDNVTMGIRSDLGKELRNLLSSDIIKGKVAVQRAYADWRRYPQYIVPLSEASIDLIFAPAYGSSKKNATDIRLAIDALELVFTRPEIGTFILLSGDSDFSSLVIKLKEYGKYVIGVGIRESSSDLLVQNCDEYYSYNALAGLVKSNEDEPSRKYDPWELVSEAVARMKRNGDVMRSDRLKQVMQEIDATFDEKNLGMSKFSRFVQEAAQRGLLSVTKLDNGQLEIGLAQPSAAAARPAPSEVEAAQEPRAARDGERDVADVIEERPREDRGRRRGRGRGRGRDRDRDERPRETAPRDVQPRDEPPGDEQPRSDRDRVAAAAQADVPANLQVAEERPASGTEAIGVGGERLTRNEAFDLVRRAVETLTTDDEDTTRASEVRRRAWELLGRDSESLSDRMFVRILKDAHDGGVVDLRRRGDDFEVARAIEVPPVADQVARADAAAVPPPQTNNVIPRLGMGPRGGGRGRARLGAAPPPELLSIGVVDEAPALAPVPSAVTSEPSAPAASDADVDIAEDRSVSSPAKRGPRKRGGRKGGTPPRGGASTPATASSPAARAAHAVEASAPTAQGRAPAKRGRAKEATKSAARGRGRAKKTAGKSAPE